MMHRRILLFLIMISIATLHAHDATNSHDATQEINSLDAPTQLPLTPELMATLTVMLNHLTTLIEQQEKPVINEEITAVMATLIKVVISSLNSENFATTQSCAGELLRRTIRTAPSSPKTQESADSQHDKHDITDKVLASFATIVTHFANIVAAPHDKRNVSCNVASIFGNILMVAKEARRLPAGLDHATLEAYLATNPLVQQLERELVLHAERLR